VLSVRLRAAARTLGIRLPWVLFPAALLAPLAPLAVEIAHGAGDRGVLGERFAVATDSPLASEAALAALERGGDAVDAAVAAAATLGVVAPAGSGLGGGGFALVWRAKEHAATAFDFRETAPKAFDGAAFEARAKASPEEKTRARGVLVGVPGEPIGLATLHARWGKRPLAEDLAPAVRAAREGFPVGRYLAEVLRGDPFGIAAHPALGPLFFEGGAVRPRTALVKRPALARTLERFGAEGSAAFYAGPIAEHLVAAARAHGSAMTLEDLRARAVEERAPLVRTFGRRAVHTMPAPSAGGLMALEALTLFGADGTSSLARTGAGSSAQLHAVAEAMRGALSDRLRFLGDPSTDAGANARVEAALDAKRLRARADSWSPLRAHAAVDDAARERGTSHLVVVDAEGNVVSLTTTINGPFGARIETEDGVLLNDELDDFTTRAEAERFLGKEPSPNRPRPHARPVSSMMPTLVLEDGEPLFVVGGSGGRRIATACTQVLLRALVFGDDAAEAVAAPRVHIGADLELLLEREVPADVENALRARGNEVKRDPMKAAVQAVRITREGGVRTLHAAADPRKYGLALAR
jgi:gamma-glutamyltranspeptidase/glutathione hydrolase